MNIDDWTGTQIGEDVIEQAAQWVAALDADNTQELKVTFKAHGLGEVDTQQAFYTWLSQDPVHQMAFVQVSEIWAKTACLKHAEHLLEPSMVLSFPSRVSHQLSAENNLHSSFNTNLSDPPLLQERYDEAASPAWVYYAVIGMISLGVLLSFSPT